MKSLHLLLACAMICLAACNGQQYDLDTETRYQHGKETLADTEKKYPVKFLRAEISYKRNLLGQTVVRGKIFNNAKMVTFKDAELKLLFYSKTRALLEEDHETIYESVAPGGSSSFKSKFFAPKGTDSVGAVLLSAKY